MFSFQHSSIPTTCSGVQRHGMANLRRTLRKPRTRLTALTCLATPPDGSGPDAGPRSTSGPGPNLSDPVETIYWGGTLPNRRRAVLGVISGTAIALGGNLGGITSWLLGLDGGALAGRLRADVLVPVRGAKRCVDYTYGFEFTYPASWLGDQTLAYRAAKRAEAARGGLLLLPGSQGAGGFNELNDLEDPNFPRLSPPSPSSSSSSSSPSSFGRSDPVARMRQRPMVAVAEPVAAFGPPGTTGEENVSVIVAPIASGFSLQSLGDPQEAGKRFLKTLAPEGSGLQTAVLSTTRRTTPGGEFAGSAGGDRVRDRAQGAAEEQLYYTLEYTVHGPQFFRHNVSVYTARSDLLYTFNAQCPEARWQEDASSLLAAAASFKLF